MNQILATLLLAFLGSQGVKMLSHSIKQKKFKWQFIFETGGMPSGHSALVSALLMSIYFIEGFSTSFFIAFILAFIVIRDATGVRYTAGIEGEFLKKLLRKHKIIKSKKDEPHFNLGHTPIQAFVGTIVGIISAMIVFII